MAKVKVIGKWLTTLDNPYDYWTQHDDWVQWDQDAGYKTPGLIARIAAMSNSMSDKDIIESINDAVEKIYSINPSGNYRIIQQEQEIDDDR